MTQTGFTLVVGGARSGKSRFAEALVSELRGEPVYVATASAGDDEMARRIAEHRARRGEGWRTVETPILLHQTLRREAIEKRVILIDCLTLWLSNLMMEDRPIEEEFALLKEALTASKGRVVAVSNEVGLGIVPENRLARRFRDLQGQLNQEMAALASEVYFIAAGLPLRLKPQ